MTARLLLVAAGCVALAAWCRASVPAPEPGRDAAWSPRSAKILFLGRRTTAATATWIRVVDRYASGDLDPDHLERALHAIAAFDPGWVAPWFFGVWMLPDTEGARARRLLGEAADLHPDVPWFAWRAGMASLDADRDRAMRWLRRAATAPGADPAWAEALAAFEARP